MMFATGYVGTAGGLFIPLVPIIVPLVLLVTMKLLWSKYHSQHYDPACDAPLPDGSMGWPIVGETFQLLWQSIDFYRYRFAKHGMIFKTHILGKPIIRIYGVENLQKIFQYEHEFLAPSLPKSTAVLLGGQTLNQAVGARHTYMRKKIGAAFRHHALASYVPIIQKEIAETIDEWCQRPSVIMYDEFGDLTFRITGKTLCGFNYSKEETKTLNKTFQVLVDNMFSLPFIFPGSGLQKGINAKNEISERIESKLRLKREMPITNDKKDALSILMEYTDEPGAPQLTNSEIRTLAMEMLFAGFATSTSASTMLMVNLTNHPDVLKRIKEELMSHDLLDKNHSPTIEDIQKLKYLSCVVKESLRVAPPVGGGFRKVKKTFTLQGKQIPKGWTILWSIRETMANSNVYTNVDEFNPDRFAEGRNEDKIGNRLNYCVFGGGPRGCVGKQLAILNLKILTIELVRRCRWERTSEEKIKMTYLPVPRPSDGLHLKFSRTDDLDANANLPFDHVKCCHVHVDEIGPNSACESRPSLV